MWNCYLVIDGAVVKELTTSHSAVMKTRRSIMDEIHDFIIGVEKSAFFDRFNNTKRTQQKK